MPDALDYEAAIRVLRGSLLEAGVNLRAFDVRSRGRPRLLTARDWAELAGIEALLAARLEQALARELRVEPWTWPGRVLAFWRGVAGGLAAERAFAASRLRAATEQPVEQWRAAAPQLESTLWPFFSQRTRYLANTMALALDEPAPYPPLVWLPRDLRFKE